MKQRKQKPNPTGSRNGGFLVGLRLPGDIYKDVAAVAAEIGITPQAWIGAVVRRALQRREDVLSRTPPMEK